jgi:bacteriocin-like protein
MKELSKTELQAVGGGDALGDLINEAVERAREILDELRRAIPFPFPNRNN